ncbi:uncharacterized protein LOC134259718 isoform X2 [Saccostrea cucullata]|uniref:uncharacterized protein LOC134259718 isoform X2 n=1 Tax=Saccostrea cuccullata TaxID=36930 RepID=UPI002ED0C217
MKRAFMFKNGLQFWKISLNFPIIIVSFVFLNIIYALDEERCVESQKTVQEVVFCPRSEDEWNQRARLKNCTAIQHNCFRQPRYHCVINEWGDKNLEVCAPGAKIPAGFCAEYNTLGRKIQEFYVATCKLCKTDYPSTSAYIYTECYKKTGAYSLHQNYGNTTSGSRPRSQRIADQTFMYGMCILMFYTIHV